MRFRLALLAGLVAFASGANAQPTAAAALNSARYGIPGLPGYGVAQGSMATLFGTQYPAVSKVVTALPLTKVWETVAIQITVNGTTKDAYPLILQGAGQLSFIVPSDIPVGTGTITVTVNGVTGTPGPITILPRNFGIFTTNFTGSGPAVMLNPLNNAANSLTNAANPNEELDIWGTGLGAVDPAQEALKPLPGNLASATVKVNVGGKDATVVYKGRSGCCIGIDQIRFKVPTGLSGCYVPVYVTVNDTVSNFATMSIAPTGRTCSDAGIGYTSEDISRALSANGLKTGGVLLSRLDYKISYSGLTGEFKTDTGSGSFQKWNAALLNQSNNAGFGVTPIGSCIVYTQKSSETTPSEVVTVPELDAGPALTVTSPSGTAKQLPKVQGSKGTYAGKLGGGITIPDLPIPIPGSEPPFLDPGVFRITGPGGADVGAFDVSLTVPTALTWTDMDTITTVNRAQDLPIHFSGGGAGDLVVILGFSSISQPEAATGSFICTTRATGGAVTFNVPSAVLMQLPANAPSTDPENPEPTGLVMLGTTTDPAPFTASGLDKGFAVSSVSTGKTVSFQ